MTTNNPVVSIGEPVAGQSATLRKRMRILAADLTKHTFDLAEAFLQAQETRCYAEWGFESLGDYAELELGVKPRKSQYLARIARVMRDCGIKRPDFEGVGVTKLRSITSLDPESTFYDAEEKKHTPMVELITELVAEAPELSLVEVEERIAHLKGMDGENAMVTKSYSVTKSCYENTIQRCFESVRMRLGSAGRDGMGAAKEYSDGAVVECLAAEYNADPRNFMEDPDESRVQIEVAEESNVSTSRALDPVDSTEVAQESLQEHRQPLVIQSED
jgi:hypothetical protein